MRSEALANVKIASNASHIRLSLNDVNNNYMADLRICWRIWCFFKVTDVELPGSVGKLLTMRS
jgi:hypothetical protein